MIPRTGSRTQALPAGVVDVWRVSSEPLPRPRPQLDATLSAAEHAHALRLGPNATPWVVARAALRMILSGYAGVSAESLRFIEGTSGKPRLAPPHRLEFSLSHSGTMALIAVASDRAVGVDLERMRDDVDIDEVTREFLSAADAAALAFSPADQRREAFFRAWTRREARLKLKGQPLDTAVVEPVLPAGGLAVTRALDIAPGYAATIAAEGGSWTVRVRDFPEATAAL